MNAIEFADKFFEIEKKFNFFNITDKNGLFYWDIVRNRIYFMLEHHITEVNRVASDKLSSGARKVFAKTISLLKNKIRFLYKINFEKYRYICCIVSRYQDNAGAPVDYCSKDILDMVQKDSLLIENYGYTGLETPGLDKVYCTFLLDKIRKKLPHRKEKYEISYILNDEFGVNLDFNALIFKKIYDYKVEYGFYNKMLMKVKPEAVFLVNNESYKALIAAANNLDIPTIEIQHGRINYGHPSYSYERDISYEHIQTIPTYLFTFSDFWSRNVFFPVREKISVGNDFFFTEPSGNKKPAITVVFASIYTIDLLGLTKDLARKHEKIPIYVKLHPSQDKEIDYIKKELKEHPNVRVVFNEKNMKELFLESNSIVTIHSTTAYEALQGGVKVFIYKRQNYYLHDDIFDNDNVYLVENVDDMSKGLNETFKLNKENMFFEKFDETKVKNLLKKIQYKKEVES